ncbi:MAG: hypothetical protein KatS3mg102_0710 [Planctomycetota bacterium]|nr:MAG: hypothetical protein KatS3mg102_0710 [Planctomycetota bacterium]
MRQRNGRGEAADNGLTRHAAVRMAQRGISRRGVELALDFGRERFVRGARIFVIGRREIERARRCGVDLADLEGLHVVVSHDGHILTTYRNRDLRGLRPKRPHGGSRSRRKGRRWHGVGGFA